MALFKKKPNTDTENGSAMLQEDGNMHKADSSALLSGGADDDARGTHQSEQSTAVLNSALDDQFDGNSEKMLRGGAFPLADVRWYQRSLWLVLLLALIALVVGGWWVASRSNNQTRQIKDVSAALIQSQLLAKAISESSEGNEGTFQDLRQNADALARSLRSLRTELSNDYAADLGRIMPLADRVGKSASVIVAQQNLLIDTGHASHTIGSQSDDLLAAAEQILALKMQRGASPAEIAAAGQLAVLTQRIGKAASAMLTANGVNPTAMTAFDKDLARFYDTARGLLYGSEQLRLPAAHDPDTRDKIQDLLKMFDKTRAEAAGVLSDQQTLGEVRAAQLTVTADSDVLARTLGALQGRLSAASIWDWQGVAVLLVPLLIAFLAAIGSYAQLRSSRWRHQQAEQQRLTAEQQRQEAKRINDAHQAAILRLMNELQAVAEGDLTQEATVTEDITGAIADSVNYTVEELRALVGNVQGAVERVTQTTSKVEMTSTELLATSTEQLREIRATGQSVVDMVGRINHVSSQAQESAQVAHQSLQAAASGLTAVQNSIGGMNAIRDQIQETSKRIKRLGESSQEIGEITELIADITEQTNVLALNAAIQAASAGEAGRGFSVVAEEVQRLAERSGGATRQIAALVKAIQTDTQDAVAAMERSTRGVVEGARLSDNAGTALTEIDRVSHRLAQIIEQISATTAQEAQKADVVAGNIRHIFAVTEQTGESTRSTASQLHELALIADELRQSVARFKIA